MIMTIKPFKRVGAEDIANWTRNSFMFAGEPVVGLLFRRDEAVMLTEVLVGGTSSLITQS